VIKSLRSQLESYVAGTNVIPMLSPVINSWEFLRTSIPRKMSD